MNTDAYPNIYDFLKCRNVAICGDIHGDFNLLVNKVCIQYQMKDTLIIVAGDCGFGFDIVSASFHAFSFLFFSFRYVNSMTTSPQIRFGLIIKIKLLFLLFFSFMTSFVSA